MKLFLSSSGLPKEIRRDFLGLLPKNPSELKVAFIPTAAYPEPNQTYIGFAKDELKELGFQNIRDLDIKDETEPSIARALKDIDIIYVNGGNTFFLLYWIRKSGFNKIIRKLKDKNIVYLGISAGSYVACPTIEMATWKHQDRNIMKMKDFTALNLVPFLLTAHFEEKYRKDIEEGAKKTDLPVVALNDKQAIIVESGKIKLVGDKNQVFYNGFEKLIS